MAQVPLLTGIVQEGNSPYSVAKTIALPAIKLQIEVIANAVEVDPIWRSTAVSKITIKSENGGIPKVYFSTSAQAALVALANA